MTNPSINVLLVEDNPGDVELIKLGLEESRMLIDLTIIMDGQEALNFFTDEKGYPDLILLDINLPKVSGLEILKHAREISAYELTPIVILTSSEAEQDIAAGYSSNANSYISKPVDVNKFLDVVNTIEDFWLAVVKLPKTKSDNN